MQHQPPPGEPAQPYLAYPPTNALQGAGYTPPTPFSANPYRQFPPSMGPQTRSEYEYASILRRFVALIIDGIFVAMFGSLLLIVIDLATGIRLFGYQNDSTGTRANFGG